MTCKLSPIFSFPLNYCSENEEGDIEFLEQRVDQICQEYINKMNEKIVSSQQQMNENAELVAGNRLKDGEISELLQAKKKLEQEIQLYLTQGTQHQQNLDQALQTRTNLEKEIEALRSANQKLKIDSDAQISKLGEDLKILQAKDLLILENFQKEKDKEIEDLSIALQKVIGLFGLLTEFLSSLDGPTTRKR